MIDETFPLPQRLLLTLLLKVDGRRRALTNTDFQGLLFLFVKIYQKRNPFFEFVPHRYGPFSYGCFRDKWTLMKNGLLKRDDHHWQLTDRGKRLSEQHPMEEKFIGQFLERHGKLHGRPLLAEIYCRYPFYATRSLILDEVLPDRTWHEHIHRARAPRIRGGIVTVGFFYLMKLEGFLNLLVQHSVTVLCDLRVSDFRRPRDKSLALLNHRTLVRAAAELDIRYLQLPGLRCPPAALGVSHARRMDEYERRIRSNADGGLETLRKLEHNGQRLALVDDEKDPNNPRKRLAALLAPDSDQPVIHLPEAEVSPEKPVEPAACPSEVSPPSS